MKSWLILLMQTFTWAYFTWFLTASACDENSKSHHFFSAFLCVKPYFQHRSQNTFNTPLKSKWQLQPMNHGGLNFQADLQDIGPVELEAKTFFKQTKNK